jgi:hypothetical protein
MMAAKTTRRLYPLQAPAGYGKTRESKNSYSMCTTGLRADTPFSLNASMAT